MPVVLFRGFRLVTRSTVCICLILAATLALAGNPIPFVNQPLVPGAAVPGGVGFTLTVNGANFVSGATVKWNGSPRTTTFVSSSQLTASILASDIATAGSAQVTVTDPGSISSMPALFPIVSPGTGAGFSFTENTSVGDPLDPVVGDFNGDGKADLVVFADDYQLHGTFYNVLLGNGDGTFKTLSRVEVADIPTVDFQLAVDLNGDGKLDLFAVDNTGSLSLGVVLLGNGDGTFQLPQTFLLGDLTFGNVVAADFNKDGKLDLAACVTGGNQTQVSIFLGNGDGTFQNPISFVGGGALAVGDFNGDGILDLLAGDEVFLGNGDGTFRAGQVITGIGGVSAVADLNSDGKLDAIFTGQFGFTVLLGNGDGTFTAGQSFGTPYSPSVMSLGDFNGDGKVDIVAAGFEGCCTQMSTLLGNGDGTFQPSTDTSFAPYVSLLPSPPVVADFNTDGYSDLAFPAAGGTNLAIAVALGTTVQLSPYSLYLGSLNVGTTGPPQSVTLTNFATTSLAINSIGFGGANPDQFTLVSNNCGSNLGSGASCTVAVSCSPTIPNSLSASLLFTDLAAASPQAVSLGCFAFGTTPMAQFSPTSLTFPTQAVGTVSPVQGIKLTNVGNKVFEAFVELIGKNPTEFSVGFGPCSNGVQPGSSCTFNVNFAPEGSGTRTATLEIVSNAPNSPQSIPLTGTGGPNLGLGIAPQGSSSATVTAGDTASYSLSIGGGGTSGTATLTCTGAPFGATCTVPGSENLSATTATTFTVSVKTTARTSASLVPQSSLGWFWATALIGQVFLPGATGKNGRTLRWLRGLPILVILFITACGGGGGGGSTGTPAGTYTLTVTATMGSTQQSKALTLIVK